MSATDILLWGVLPYVVTAVFVVGHVWRYRYDQFGWTTRSSEVYEKKLLRWGSPMFHVGVLMVAGGHVVGLLIPREWLYAIGIDEHMYHLGATWLGTFAAVLTVVGLAILIYRRRRTRSVFLATTRMDKLMFVALGAAIAFGTAATVVEQIIGGGYNYRETISPWIRSVMYFQPDVALMDGIPVLFALHVVSGLLLLALWPFTRLVHVWSAPVGYLVRPYIVYRSRDVQQGLREGRPGWDPVETRSRKR